MIILVGCEESQTVCKAFREKGHEAYSCDLQECSGGHPEWHLQIDVFKAINGGYLTLQNGETVFIEKWDMGIFFPTCTFLTISANTWYRDNAVGKPGTITGYDRYLERIKAIKFFIDIYYCGIKKIGIENPIGIMSSVFRTPDQIIQPWQFGHGETKATCLWLNGLPLLKPTDIVEGREQRIWKMAPGPDRTKLRSKTYEGIATAMANQWG